MRDFGEFQQFLTKPADASWQNLYCDSKNMAATGQDTAYPLNSSSPIPSLNSVSVPGFPKFDTSVPDVIGEQIWKQDFEKNGPANLNMFWLSSDHTGGPANAPAQVADNDLATGKIVDEISHSKYWKDSAIFVVEDDSQAGLDHVDGHRAPIQIISPWGAARHRPQPLLLADHDDPGRSPADPRDPPDEPEGQRGQPDAWAFTRTRSTRRSRRCPTGPR
ncbi:hypothetical protein SALBM311S_00779 [Streptomyces alboniger]